MILSGLEIITRELVRNLRHVAQQQQPCGVDLTLRRVSRWKGPPATLDFDDSKREAAKTVMLPFEIGKIRLGPGAYLIDFNETVQIPKNCMASVFPRSSLWRSGVGIEAGVVHAGYGGEIGTLMEVKHPHGVVLWRDAKLAQIVIEEVTEDTGEGYRGVYQGSNLSGNARRASAAFHQGDLGLEKALRSHQRAKRALSREPPEFSGLEKALRSHQRAKRALSREPPEF